MKPLHIAVLSGCLLISGCSGCSRSGRMKFPPYNAGATSPGGPAPAGTGAKTVVKMMKEGDVYKIPVTVDGADMSFIFDTGAGLISISNIEASYLYKEGKLRDEDVVGQANFLDANGNISVGTIIILREVTIGNRTIRDIKASVVNNSQAPLLFGQSAMEKFGRVSIDYANQTVTFE